MIVNIIIIILLIGGFFTGYRNGFIRQLVVTLGYFLSFFVAYHYFSDLAPHLSFIPYPGTDATDSVYKLLEVLHTEEAYYNAIAFIIIFLAAIIIVHMISSLIGNRTKIPVISQVNGLIGGVLGVIAIYLFIFVVLYLTAIFPAEWAENLIHSSSISEWILENTPILSERFYDWMTGVLPE